MFTALKTKDQTRVTSIAAEWDRAENVLREWAAVGQLVCQACKQMLWLRCGIQRRRHFAHRSLTDCPLENQSPEVLEIKAQLYRWFERTYPGKVNFDIPIPNRDKYFDIVIEPEPGRQFAYCVFDRQQRDRENLISCRAFKGVSLHFINAASTLKRDPSDNLLLTASQRDFIQPSSFDTWPARETCGHLHFFDPEKAVLTIYRKLVCVHRPNLYCHDICRTGSLDSALLDSDYGEIVFPEDMEARASWRHKCESEQLRFREQMNEQERDKQREMKYGAFAKCVVRCKICGVATRDWDDMLPRIDRCLCRTCAEKGHQLIGGTTPKGGNENPF